jgi:hypothetical protein
MFRRPLLLATVVSLAVAAPAQAAHSFVLTRSGSMPSLAVDRAGTGHFVWDERAPDGGSVTHYCRVARRDRGCAAGSERTFRPTQVTDPANNTDFDGPRVFVAPDGRIVVFTYRCCAIAAPNFHSSALFRYVSADGGNTFDAGAIIGITAMDDAVFGPGDAVTVTGIGGGFTGVQSAPLAAFTEAQAQLAPGVTPVDHTVTLAGGRPVTAFGDGKTFSVAVANGDPNVTPSWAVGPAAHGSELQLASSPKGTFLFLKSGRRYVLRRVSTTTAKLGRTLGVTSSTFPIFGTAAGDAGGRIHAVWQERGLRYRRTTKSASRLERAHRLVLGSGFFNLAIAAGANSRGWVAWDSNGENRTVRAIAIP